ncbi:MAG: Planctomycete cytochrome [Chthoniobacteraceae bacterium]|nr:Planctomycete cytochrome [Chthoniobacteraceae bacterium]
MRLIIATFLTLALSGVAAELPPPAARAVDFLKDIEPIFARNCLKCHGADKQKGGYRLDLKATALTGGDNSAPNIVPGKSAESPLIHFVAGLDPEMKMPSKGDPLTAEQIGLLRAWIDQGAPWPENVTGNDPLDWWSLKPSARTAPGGAATDGVNPIDAFIRVQLAGKGLVPSPEADARTLCRRLYFDLIGLPPTPEEVDAFVKDSSRAAYKALVDKLLASPHYGERWARHWLDIAHYADTHGFERDQRRDNAWRFRDWVIRALNADKPYNEFLREQIAGDALRPADPEAVIATGFLAAGPWDFVGQSETPSPVLKRLARADDLDDMVTQVMTAACGMTVNCARCHDHKLDPIPQREYFALCAVFAGVKRGERDVDAAEVRRRLDEKTRLQREMGALQVQLARMENHGLDLADIVGGGDGNGSGTKGAGVHVETGKRQDGALPRLTPKANVFVPVDGDFIDGVVLPNGEDPAGVPISTTGLKVRGIPKTGGEAWDAIRNGLINPQGTTKIGDVDFATAGHSLLGLHANAAITFDLAPMRTALKSGTLRFRATVGYGGRPDPGETNADVRLFIDGEPAFVAERVGPKTGRLLVNLVLPESARFLTLMSTDGADGQIGFDQIFYGDPRISAAAPVPLTAAEKADIEPLKKRIAELGQQIKSLPEPAKVYAITTEQPPVVRVQHRGNPEDPRAEAAPGALSCVRGLGAQFGGNELTDAQRRIALAEWITAPANPLTRRVIVNRLWHHHFGAGLVDTPSDFGTGGGRPSHPELLDWLAEEFGARGWSLKAMHRLIVTSATYRQRSEAREEKAESIDGGNRLLWRMNPRRLDAESLRDAVLSVSGKLNGEMFGPGYRDFDYTEEYAPVYKYITPDRPELWRRSIYRFVVRTTPQQFMTALDCPNSANLTPARNITTTTLQSLALLNNDFMQKQAGYFAQRVEAEGGGEASAQGARAFALAFGRKPDAAELDSASALVKSHGLPQLCRMLLNTNEFVYVD